MSYLDQTVEHMVQKSRLSCILAELVSAFPCDVLSIFISVHSTSPPR